MDYPLVDDRLETNLKSQDRLKQEIKQLIYGFGHNLKAGHLDQQFESACI